MTPALRELLSTFPLPEGWSSPEVVEDSLVADGVEVHRAGVASVGPDGEELTGSAADTEGSPSNRSYFELLERVSIVEALRSKGSEYEVRTAGWDPAGRIGSLDVFPESDEPSRWRYARSNGVALHVDWRTACVRASWELVERDRVLRAWYGETRPEPVAFPCGTLLTTARTYDMRAFAFPEPNDGVRFGRDVEVVGVFGFPKNDDAPLVLGFAARPGRAEALEAAAGEALQSLAFLWGEPTPRALPSLGPTPGHHLDHFQWHGSHATLSSWLDTGHQRHASKVSGRGRDDGQPVRFLDLTPAWLGGGLRVAKAICASATPLTFGDSPLGRHLPVELQVHPVA
jgi:hypothetical protein